MRHSVQQAVSDAGGTRLTLSDGRAVRFPALPDLDGRSQVHAALRRVTQVEVTVDGEWVTTTVRGIGHRRSCELSVSLETALALAVEGCPCSVRVIEVATVGEVLSA